MILKKLLKKLNNKIPDQSKLKILKIGERILNENMIYVNKFIR